MKLRLFCILEYEPFPLEHSIFKSEIFSIGLIACLSTKGSEK
jgi:hypothetical protein